MSEIVFAVIKSQLVTTIPNICSVIYRPASQAMSNTVHVLYTSEGITADYTVEIRETITIKFSHNGRIYTQGQS